ncbi:MAG: hypothetical protein ACTSXC_07325 [Candidatus Freyarchaeota archaeon]
MSILPVDPRIYKKYKVVACPRCGKLQAVQATKVFRCRFCGFKDRIVRLRIFYASDSGKGLPEIVRQLSKKYRGRIR